MDEVQRLILKVEGETELSRLNALLDAEKRNLEALLHQKAQNPAAQNLPQIERSAGAVLQLNKEIASLQRETRGLSSGSLLQLQYVLDDLINTSGNWERHLASISNNIPGVVSSLGLGAGLAGAVGLVSTAFIALAPVAKAGWDALLNPNADKVVDALKKVTDEVERVAKAYQKLRETPTEAEAKGAKALEKTINELKNGDQLQKRIFDAILASGMGEKATAEESEATEGERLRSGLEAAIYGKPLLSPEQRAADRVRKRIDEANSNEAKRLLIDATAGGETGRAARAKLRFLGKRPGVLPASLLMGLDEAEPEAVAAKEERERQWKANEEIQRQQKHARDAAARERDEFRRDADREQAAVLQRMGHGQRAQDHAQQQRQREADRETLQDEREGERMRIDQAREAKERPVKQAAATLGRSFQEDFGTSPDQSVLLHFGQEAINSARMGADMNSALTAAYADMIQSMQRQQARVQQQMQNLNQLRQMNSANFMGPDFSGSYSLLPPL